MRLSRYTPHWLNQFIYNLLPASVERKIMAGRDVDSEKNYVPVMVSHESKLNFDFKRHVLKKNPKLHRVVVHLTDHCNLNCKGCTHFSNIASPAFTDVEEFRNDFLRLSKTFSDITEIYLLGGEPLLHKDVSEFVHIARGFFPKSRINLMSNGLLVPKMSEEFFKALHDSDVWLVLDLYPVNLKVEEIERLTKLYDVKLEWTDPRGEFFKLPIDLTGSQDKDHAFRGCGPFNNCVLLRNGRLYPCAYAAYSDILVEKYDLTDLAAVPEDSISLYEGHDPYEIFDFLCNPIPWCRFCDVDAMTTYDWGHSKGTLDEWLA